MTKYSFLKHEEANFLQSEEWGKVAEKCHHKPIIMDLENGDSVLMLVKNARRGRYLEIPGGPLIDWDKKKVVEEAFRKIKEVAKSEKCVFIRFRPQLLNTPENREIIKTTGSKPAPFHLHAQNTVILNLEKDPEELLASMRRQTRYEVRRAQKQNLKVVEDNTEKTYQAFHGTQTLTAKRQGFIPPSLKELLAERQAFGSNAHLYVSQTEAGEPIAYGLVLSYGKEAAYFEAASTELNQKLPGAYALLWHAIRSLKSAGCQRFNLWGIAPPGVKNHRYSGVTTFKTGFGGKVVEYLPAQDIVIKKLRYKVDELVENTRKKKRNL